MAGFEMTFSRHVNAPPEVVFRLLNDVDKFFDLQPNATDHRDIEMLPSGGHHCTQEYRAGDRRVTQRCTNLEFDPPTRTVYRAEGDGYIHHVTTTLSGERDGTRLTVDRRTEFTTPVSALRRYFAKKNARRSLEQLVRRVSTLVSGG